MKFSAAQKLVIVQDLKWLREQVDVYQELLLTDQYELLSTLIDFEDKTKDLDALKSMAKYMVNKDEV